MLKVMASTIQAGSQTDSAVGDDVLLRCDECPYRGPLWIMLADSHDTHDGIVRRKAIIFVWGP
jgi:hypothetical protein